MVVYVIASNAFLKVTNVLFIRETLNEMCVKNFDNDSEIINRLL